ncbi:uncharacterized protein [Miscanthus floridulus]|uniref:uncharacterized protein n=1 Tax=Miscanthus floridulus TaxID=154761 RepID=UPI0034578B11
MGEASGFTNTFVVKHLIIHDGGDAGEEVPITPATKPSTPGVVPSTPGGVLSTPEVVPSGPTVVPTTPGRVPNAPVAEPRGLAVVPITPRLVPTTPIVVPTTPGVVTSGPGVVPSTVAGLPSTSGVMPTTPAEQGTPSTQIEFASPPSDITEFVDAFHDGEEVRFHRLDNIVDGTGSSGLAGRLLNDPDYFLSVQRNHPCSW